jgi:hypothetical protein
MKKTSQPHWVLQEIAEQRSPKDTINLWSHIASRLEDRPSERKIGMVARARRGPVAWMIAVAILLIAIGVAVPQARASVSGFLQRMGMEFTQSGQGPENAGVENVEPVRVTPRPSMSLEEIRRQFPYKLMVPTWLPGDLALAHASLSRSTSPTNPAGSPCVRLVYRTVDAPIDDPQYLSFQVSPDECGGPFLLPGAKEQAVTINDQPGSFVKGGWRSDGKGDPETTYGSLQWDDLAGDTYLAWSQDNLNYFMAAFQLDLTKEEMIQVAESLQAP